jgi:hypothetical protein
VAGIRERAEEVKLRQSVEISPDPGDDPFCLCASKLVSDGIVADVAVLPATIQPFKSVAREPATHVIAKDQSPPDSIF